MKKVILDELIEKRLEELRNTTTIDEETGEEVKLVSYKLFDFCVEVVPEGERQSKHIDILEYLLDHGYQIRWKGLKFQPKKR